MPNGEKSIKIRIRIHIITIELTLSVLLDMKDEKYSLVINFSELLSTCFSDRVSKVSPSICSWSGSGVKTLTPIIRAIQDRNEKIAK